MDEYGSKLKNLPKRKKYYLGGAIFMIFVLLIWFSAALVSIDKGHVGVVFAKFGDTPDKERIIVEERQRGIQREVLMPGWKFYPLADKLWRIDIEEKPMFEVPKHYVGVVEALDGMPLKEGQILADDDFIDKDGVFHMGQKGPRMAVLKPGLHPINPYYLKAKLYESKMIKDGSVGIVTNKIGKEPPSDTILVSKGDGFRGIQKEVLGPGEYYLNPLAVDVDIVDAIVIEKGEIGIVTKKIGENPPHGTVLVSKDDNFQGIQREVLQPGMYYEYAHPHRFAVKVVPAVTVPDGNVGVQIARTGDPKPADQLLAKPGQRGILEEVLSPGIFYLNPYEFDVVVFDIRQQRYEMTFVEGMGDTAQSDSIKFLSDDGFEIEIDLTVLYEVMPQNAPYVVATVGRTTKEVQEKIIRPSARSFARIIGSTNKGEEFVHGTTRENFQNELHDRLQGKCVETKVKINATLIRHFAVPKNLRDPITTKVIAQKLEQQYVQQQKTQIANAELEKQKRLVDFQAKKVEAETEKMQAMIRAEREKEVASIEREKKAFEAEGDATKVKINAEANLFAAQKDAEGIRARILGEKLAEAEGRKALVDAMSGSGANMLVAIELAKVLQGAKILPLETLLGGGGSTTDGKGNVLRYQNNLELLKLLKIFDVEEEVKANSQK